MDRKFEDVEMKRERVPLLIGITGTSGSGKTYSALELATGIQRVSGGEIFVVDTENRRAAQYADYFKARHVDMHPPYGPLDYMAAIDHCVRRGAGVVIVDSMTHEHEGPGGVMDQIEQFLERKCGDDYKKRQAYFMLANVEPKAQRKKLNSYVRRMPVHAIFCYRAQSKIKPQKGKDPLELGFQPVTTSDLHYDMTQRFLLLPGAEGVPTWNPEQQAEKTHIKKPRQFAKFFRDGERLSADMGERMARWAEGDKAPSDEPFRLPSGEHKGKTLAEVPDPYLTKLHGVTDGKPLQRLVEQEIDRRMTEQHEKARSQ